MKKKSLIIALAVIVIAALATLTALGVRRKRGIWQRLGSAIKNTNQETKWLRERCPDFLADAKPHKEQVAIAVEDLSSTYDRGDDVTQATKKADEEIDLFLKWCNTAHLDPPSCDDLLSDLAKKLPKEHDEFNRAYLEYQEFINCEARQNSFEYRAKLAHSCPADLKWQLGKVKAAMAQVKRYQ